MFGKFCRWHWWIYAGAILLSGIVAIVLIVHLRDGQLRKSILTRAETIGASFHDDLIKALSGTEADLSTHAYNDFKKQMMAMRNVNPDVRFIYAMGVRDDQLFFYGDSEVPGGPDESPPGQIYTEASSALVRAARTGKPVVEGPVTDRWGTWISAYAPVRDSDPLTVGRLLATVGVDISAESWRHEIFYAASLPFLITFFLELLLAFYYLYSRRQHFYLQAIRNEAKHLREIDRMKSEFVSLASHQLLTPLSGIKWFGESLLKGRTDNLTHEQRDSIQKMFDTNSRMITLVTDLLSVSRIETGHNFTIDKKVVDFVSLIDTVLADLAGLARQREVVLKKAARFPRKLLLQIDEDKIRHALQNLLNNAIKYSSVHGTVTIACDVSSKHVVLVSIKDHGIGIPAADQPHLFEKFFRARNVHKKESAGTGLGLYIARAIIQGHGGKIWFDSAANKGATFYFSLPRPSKILKNLT